MLPGRHGPAGRRRLRAQVARRAARHRGRTTGTPCSWARATASTRCARSRAGSGLDDHVTFTGRIPDDELLAYLSTADVALSPDPHNPLNDVSTMNKVLEYMAVRPADRLLRPLRGARLRRRRRPLRRRATTPTRSRPPPPPCSTIPPSAAARADRTGARRRRAQLGPLQGAAAGGYAAAVERPPGRHPSLPIGNSRLLRSNFERLIPCGRAPRGMWSSRSAT